MCMDDYVGKCCHYHLFVNNMQLGPETQVAHLTDFTQVININLVE